MTISIIGIVVPILVMVICGLLSLAHHNIVGRLVDKSKAVEQRLHEHLTECNKVNKEVLHIRLTALEDEIRRLRLVLMRIYPALGMGIDTEEKH